LLEHCEHDVDSLTLIPSSGGVFEVKVDDSLLFSKKQTGRFPDPGEVLQLMEAYIKKG
jgi:selenoprotein W-related protein